MAKRRDNMLEALKASADEALEARRQQLAPPPQPRSRLQQSPPSASGAAPPRAPLPSARPDRDLPESSEFIEETGVTLPMGFAPFLALQLFLLGLVFAMGFFTGRDAPIEVTTSARSGGEVVLDDPSAARREPTGDPVREEAGTVQAAGRRAPDLAIEAPHNRVTVMVAQYNDTPYGRDRALSAFEYLDAGSFPVVTPRKRNGMIMLFVGAAVSVQELKPLQAELESLPGPKNEPNYFRSPFIVNIDDYL